MALPLVQPDGAPLPLAWMLAQPNGVALQPVYTLAQPDGQVLRCAAARVGAATGAVRSIYFSVY
ncbi:hypothetical protein [Paraburkholderia caffeinilytica]|uniref:hypothetical protein n=1 Tax=Paraburkholderia caffeinilytica TaxID=1761016 RepID=UPI0013BE9F9A|nr:hypothetical protein [Paraburkholderia caffeinilytica]